MQPDEPTRPSRARPGDPEGAEGRGPVAERLEERTVAEPTTPTADTTPLAMVAFDPRTDDLADAERFDEAGADPQKAATRRQYERDGGPPLV